MAGFDPLSRDLHMTYPSFMPTPAITQGPAHVSSDRLTTDRMPFQRCLDRGTKIVNDNTGSDPPGK